MDKKHWHASSGTMHPSVQRRWGLAFTHCRALLINDYVVHGSNADLAVLNEIRIEILNIDCPHRFAEGGHRGSGSLPGSTRRHGGCLNPAAQLEFLQLKTQMTRMPVRQRHADRRSDAGFVRTKASRSP